MIYHIYLVNQIKFNLFMIRKRQPKQEPIQQENIQQQNKPSKQLSSNNNKKYPEFKTYHEEACYVLDLLEKQGINIYEEGRYGGMYLNNHSSGKVSQIFNSTTNNKKQNNIQQINNNEFSDNDLATLFARK